MDKLEKAVLFKEFNAIEDMFKNKEVITICMECGKIKYDNNWYQHKIHNDYEHYSHGLCPEAYAMWINEIKGD